MSGQEYKLIFTGSMGAGKTTAIGSISEIPPIKTEVANTDTKSHSKAETTVAMDYGEVKLPTGDRLRLYGTPGQERFRFMWRILAQGALGVIILVDNTQEDPIQDIQPYLQAFSDLIAIDRAIIGVGRMDAAPKPTINDYTSHLLRKGLDIPVFSVDVRRDDDVLLMLDVLMHRIEVFDLLNELETGS